MDVYIEIYTSKFTPSTRDALRCMHSEREHILATDISSTNLKGFEAPLYLSGR
jgi:hypothetical protein